MDQPQNRCGRTNSEPHESPRFRARREAREHRERQSVRWAVALVAPLGVRGPAAAVLGLGHRPVLPAAKAVLRVEAVPEAGAFPRPVRRSCRGRSRPGRRAGCPARAGWDPAGRCRRYAGASPAVRMACRCCRSRLSARAFPGVPYMGSCGRREPRSVNPAGFAVEPVGGIHRGGVGWGTPLAGREETDGAGRRIVDGDREVALGHPGRVFITNKRLDNGGERRQQHQYLFQRSMVGDGDLADSGQIGQQHRQRRFDLVEQPRHLRPCLEERRPRGSRAGRSLSHRIRR
jgi:hypothetical protein